VTEQSVVRAQGFTHAEMVGAIERAGTRFVALVRSLDSRDGALPVPGLEWNVAQTAAHLIGIMMRGTGDRRRAATVQELGALNELQVTEIGEDDPAKIADLLDARLSRQLAMLGAATGDEPFELHAGLHADVKTALSYELWDFLLHGFDIARATAREWTSDPADAAIDVVGVLPALGPWVRPEVESGGRKRLEFAFPQRDDAVTVEVGDGAYAVALGAREGVEELDPVDTLLALSKRSASTHELVRELASCYLPT
jgi:hypothetical protein